MKLCHHLVSLSAVRAPSGSPLPLGHGRRQRGVALFFALVLLLVLTVLGLAAVQVSTLQERMAGNYRTQNLALQDAEGLARLQEFQIQRITDSGAVFPSDIENCAAFDSQSFANALKPDVAQAKSIKRLDRCNEALGFADKSMGKKLNEATSSVYQITASGLDHTPTNSSAVVVVETVFIP